MYNIIVKDGFECDKPAKQILGNAIKWYCEQTYGECSAYTATTEDPKAHFDLSLTADTPNRPHLAVIEMKERTSDRLYVDEMCEAEKGEWQEIQDYRNSGYTFLWASIYPNISDDYYQIYIWDYDKTPKRKGKSYQKKHTVLDEKKVEMEKWFMRYEDAIMSFKYPKS